MGMRRGHHARPWEWLVEKTIFLVSLSAILTVFLIFVFVTREALPVMLGRTNNAMLGSPTTLEDLKKMSKDDLKSFLGLTEAQWTALDDEGRQQLMEVRAESLQESTQEPDQKLNTTSWRYLIRPHQWAGYPEPDYIWQPVSRIPKFNIVPLIIGSLKTTVVALLFAVPLALAAAIYVSQLCSARWKEVLKPAIELLAGIPSVVLGFFALIVLATVLQKLLGSQSRLNTLLAGIALGLAVIPVVFSIAEDALTSVPKSYVHGALALGASRWQAAWQVVLPAALPGVLAAVVLGFGRAIGETMVVLMASGNASLMSWSFLDSSRTITATIAAELAETVFGGQHYRILFFIGSFLFIVTFAANVVADEVIHRLKRRMEGIR
jgi:phosphate transport system permease protein